MICYVEIWDVCDKWRKLHSLIQGSDIPFNQNYIDLLLLFYSVYLFIYQAQLIKKYLTPNNVNLLLAGFPSTASGQVNVKHKQS